MPQAASPEVVVNNGDPDIVPDHLDFLCKFLHLLVLALERIHLHYICFTGPYLKEDLLFALFHLHGFVPAHLKNRDPLAEGDNAILELISPSRLLKEALEEILCLAFQHGLYLVYHIDQRTIEYYYYELVTFKRNAWSVLPGSVPS